MVIQILPQDRRYADLAESFTPLAEGLGYLAGHKIGQVRARNAYVQAGMPRNQAEALSRMPRAQQQQAYQQFVERVGFPEEQQQAPAFQPQQMQQQVPQQAFQMQPQTMQNIGALRALQSAPQMIQNRQIPALQGAQLGSMAGPQYQQALASGRPQDQLQAAQSGIQALQRAQQAGALGYQPQVQQLAQQQAPQMQRQPGQSPAPFTPTGQPIQLPSEGPQIQPRTPMPQAPAAQVNPLVGTSPRLRAAQTREEREQRKLELAEKTFEHKVSKEERAEQRTEEKEIKAEAKPVYNEVNKEYKAAKESLPELNRMQKLIESGKLSNPIFHSLLDTIEHGVFGFGINLYSLESPESQEYQKLTANMLKNIKEVYPKATNLDVQMYLKSLPNLSQTNEGKLRNIAILKNVAQAKEIRKKEMDKILKENNGKFPRNFQEQLNERVEPQTDEMYQDWVLSMGEHEQSRRYSWDLLGRGLDYVTGQ